MRKKFVTIALSALLLGATQQADAAQWVNVEWRELQSGAQENAEAFARQVLDLVNRERSQRGIAPLRLSDELMDAARVRAEEITQVFSHTRPNGKPCFSVLRKRAAAAENIAAGSSTPEAVVDQWMHSDGRRKNMLNSKYNELGVGHVYKPGSEYGHYWVQLFRRGK